MSKRLRHSDASPAPKRARHTYSSDAVAAARAHPQRWPSPVFESFLVAVGPHPEDWAPLKHVCRNWRDVIKAVEPGLVLERRCVETALLLGRLSSRVWCTCDDDDNHYPSTSTVGSAAVPLTGAAA